MRNSHDIYYAAFPDHPKGWPDEDGEYWVIHHVNEDQKDNRLCNLVNCSRLQNNLHQYKRKNKSSEHSYNTSREMPYS